MHGCHAVLRATTIAMHGGSWMPRLANTAMAKLHDATLFKTLQLLSTCSNTTTLKLAHVYRAAYCTWRQAAALTGWYRLCCMKSLYSKAAAAVVELLLDRTNCTLALQSGHCWRLIPRPTRRKSWPAARMLLLPLLLLLLLLSLSSNL